MRTSSLTNTKGVNSERIRAYLDRCPAAISGQGGHAQTFSVACALVHGFALSESEALHWLRYYNQSCQPQWCEADLLHKVRDAIKKPASKPRGYLLQLSSDDTSTCRKDRFTKGTKAQLKRLANSRPYGLEGLEYASERGLLVFGDWYGSEVYGVTDQSGRLTEIRRMDGTTFPPVGSLPERKSHAIKGGEKKWPIGILEAENFPCIALFEGIPDFLEGHYIALWESVKDRVAPVAMLSASPEIHTDALPHFKGKIVRIFPHVDANGAGIKGAEKWRRQIIAAGATRVDLFDFSPYRRRKGERVCDFYEFTRDLNLAEYQLNPGLWRVLP
ncbi:MAG: hypothetical protein ACK4UN_08130 [Limisphaerales bacterium]